MTRTAITGLVDKGETQYFRFCRATRRLGLPLSDWAVVTIRKKISFTRSTDANYKLQRYQQINRGQKALAAAQPEASDWYRYDALGPRQIRLLQLQPGTAADPLSCTLSVYDLGACPEFEALSYAWGDGSGGMEVLLCAGRALSITSSLADALRQLRSGTDSARMLWADAVCINQDDVAERSAQVPLMRDIYQQAQSVAVWLGPATADSPAAFRLLRLLHQAAAADSAASAASAASAVSAGSEFPADRDIGLHLTKEEQLALGLPRDDSDSPDWRALGALIWRPWFTRMWIVQEVVLARSAVVLCGSDSLPWPALAAAARFISQHGLGNVYGLSLDVSRILTLDYTIRCGTSQDALALMATFRRSLTSDPVDKVYALLGLASVSDPIVTGIVPNYAAALQDVYCDVAAICLARSLDILSEVDASWRRTDGLPSWVPDWSSTPRKTSYQARFYLGSGLAPAEHACGCGVLPNAPAAPPRLLQDSRDGSRVLRLRGVLFDRVADRWETLYAITPVVRTTRAALLEFGANLTKMVFTSVLRIWEYSVLELKTYPTGEPIASVLHRVFVAGTHVLAGHGDLADYYAAFRYLYMHLPFLEGLIQDENASLAVEKALNDKAAAYSRALGAAANDRRLFTTRRGYVGLGPRSLKVGDCVVLLCGGKMAYVLRRQETKRRDSKIDGAQPLRYTFVGDAYVHGVMNGEGFRGDAVLQDFDIV